MNIPDTPNLWLKKYENLSTEKRLDYYKETLESEIFEKLQQKIDFIDYSLNYLGELEKNKNQERIRILINIILKKGEDYFSDADLSYLEKELIDRKLFKKEDITIYDLKHYLSNPARIFDNLNQMLKKLTFNNYSKLVDNISQKIFTDIKKDADLLAGAEADQ